MVGTKKRHNNECLQHRKKKFEEVDFVVDCGGIVASYICVQYVQCSLFSAQCLLHCFKGTFFLNCGISIRKK